jgi:hypothetical protein
VRRSPPRSDNGEVSVVEPKIDELYQMPLGGFTAARNALAKTLNGADAQRVKRLPKPTVVPWTVNQLYWHARPVYDRVTATGRALRDAQIAALKGRAADVRRATDDHRKAVADAVREGTALAAKERANPPADQLARMLEALSLAKDEPGTPGRLTELIQPSGFEALAGITPVHRSHAVSGGPHDTPQGDAPQPPATGPRLVTSLPASPRRQHPTLPRGPRRDPAEERRRAAEERRQAAEARKEAKAREAARVKAEARVQAAERELNQAQTALASAERAADDARRTVREAEDNLAAARASRVLSSPDV